MWRYGRGQPRMVSVGEAEARRKERRSEARRQGAETLKRRGLSAGKISMSASAAAGQGMRMSSEIWCYIVCYIMYHITL